MRSGLRKLFVGAGIMAPIAFTTVVLVSGRAYPGYSHTTRAISDLGTSQSPQGALMNVGGFGLVGLCIALFGVGLHRTLGARVQTLGAALAWVVEGGLLAALGAWPFPSPIHGELVLFLSFWSALAIGMGALALYREVRSIWLWPTTALALVGSMWLPLLPAASPHHLGSVQRACAGAIGLWVAVAAIHSLAVEKLRSNRGLTPDLAPQPTGSRRSGAGNR